MKRICVIGTGYVGLVTAACFAEIGNQVSCFDVDERKVDTIAQGRVPFFEPGLAALVKSNMRAGRLIPTAMLDKALEGCDFIFICVGTPSTSDGGVDLSFVRLAYIRVATALGDRRPVLVNKSTVLPGTVDAISKFLERLTIGGKPFSVASNPEFLREGHAIGDFMHPQRVVIGTRDASAAQEIASLYLPLEAPLIITDPATAELIKYASNAFLATKISFINEIAELCDEIGVDIDSVARGIGMDPRIGRDFLKAGIGFGGSCLPKDTAALVHMANSVGRRLRLIEAVRTVNSAQPHRLVERMKGQMGTLSDRRISVLGLAFKANTDDIRSAPSMHLIRRLLEEGSTVAAFDPQVKSLDSDLTGRVQMPVDIDGAVSGADALVIATDWPEFKNLDWASVKSSMRGDLIADGRNLIERRIVTAAGLRYIGVGRSGTLVPAHTAVSLD